MSKQQRSEVVKTWLIRARSDLQLEKAALRTSGVIPEDACFHAQQCVEKSLKAFLIQLAIPFPRTHVLELLLDLLKTQDIDVPKSVDEAFVLSQYAVQTRYPGIWEPVTRTEAQQALERAVIVLSWVEHNIVR